MSITSARVALTLTASLFLNFKGVMNTLSARRPVFTTSVKPTILVPVWETTSRAESSGTKLFLCRLTRSLRGRTYNRIHVPKPRRALIGHILFHMASEASLTLCVTSLVPAYLRIDHPEVATSVQ